MNSMKMKSCILLDTGTPEDIADFIVFLLSPASRWMTGQRIVIDGGRTLN